MLALALLLGTSAGARAEEPATSDAPAPAPSAEAPAATPTEIAPPAETPPAAAPAEDAGGASPATPAPADSDQSTALPVPAPPGAPPCSGRHPVHDAWLDQAQYGLYLTLCYPASWLDGLFGERPPDAPPADVGGRIGASTLWNRQDGVEPRLRMRVSVPMPELNHRVNLLFGRDDQRQAIDDRRPGASQSLPTAFRDVSDAAWLLGLGYSRDTSLTRGFSFGAGVRLRIPPDPFVKGRYHWSIGLGERAVVNLQETLFWQNSRGVGETSQMDLDRLLGERFLVRFANSLTVATDTEALAWSSSATLYQSLAPRRAIAWTAFVQGDSGADVPIQDYGVQLRYRRSIFRPWLFLEASMSVTWPRETLADERITNPGVGIGFEMYFGDVPEVEMR